MGKGATVLAGGGGGVPVLAGDGRDGTPVLAGKGRVTLFWPEGGGCTCPGPAYHNLPGTDTQL